MKKKNKEIMIVSSIYEEAYVFGEGEYHLNQTLKKIKQFYKSKSKQISAEC